MSHDKIPSARELMPAIGFTLDDLHANQTGTLGETQYAHLQRLRVRILQVGAAAFFALVLLATILLFIGQGNIILTLIGILMTMINAVMLGMFARQWMRLSGDLDENVPEVVTGKLERVINPAGKVSNYILRVDGQDFQVKKDVFKLFRHEVRYKIYRAPRSKVFLAAEPLN